jgi:hypothetical protein
MFKCLNEPYLHQLHCKKNCIVLYCIVLTTTDENTNSYTEYKCMYIEDKGLDHYVLTPD